MAAVVIGLMETVLSELTKVTYVGLGGNINPDAAFEKQTKPVSTLT